MNEETLRQDISILCENLKTEIRNKRDKIIILNTEINTTENLCNNIEILLKVK